MMCLSRTLLPPPLRPMMTTDSPRLDVQIDAVEHAMRAKALAEITHLDHDSSLCQEQA